MALLTLNEWRLRLRSAACVCSDRASTTMAGMLALLGFEALSICATYSIFFGKWDFFLMQCVLPTYV